MSTKIYVMFKLYDNGDVLALFPNIEADQDGNISSYQHIGQHGAASPDLIYELKNATPEQYASLLNELKQVGYNNLITDKGDS